MLRALCDDAIDDVLASLAGSVLLRIESLRTRHRTSRWLVLPLVIGADPYWLKTRSQFAVEFFRQLLLAGDPSPSGASRAHTVLDGLAGIGAVRAL
jgi:hypothetical protein